MKCQFHAMFKYYIYIFAEASFKHVRFPFMGLARITTIQDILLPGKQSCYATLKCCESTKLGLLLHFT